MDSINPTCPSASATSPRHDYYMSNCVRLCPDNSLLIRCEIFGWCCVTITTVAMFGGQVCSAWMSIINSGLCQCVAQVFGDIACGCKLCWWHCAQDIFLCTGACKLWRWRAAATVVNATSSVAGCAPLHNITQTANYFTLMTIKTVSTILQKPNQEKSIRLVSTHVPYLLNTYGLYGQNHISSSPPAPWETAQLESTRLVAWLKQITWLWSELLPIHVKWREIVVWASVIKTMARHKC